ncbi:MAG: hypothetical protein HYZ71_12180 [Deltaproteobacteria bacterium]|nr:hypothetical protein [Deltaproteobacteria bacterium]
MPEKKVRRDGKERMSDRSSIDFNHLTKDLSLRYPAIDVKVGVTFCKPQRLIAIPVYLEEAVADSTSRFRKHH